MIHKEVDVLLGGMLLTRQVANLSQRMQAYESRLLLRRGEMTVNGKSLMGIVSLGIQGGQRITVMAEGPDEEAVVAEFSRLMAGDSPLTEG